MAGMVAMLIIVTFMTATLYSEVSGDASMVLQVKRNIAFPGIEILLLFMVMAGGTGRSLAKNFSNRAVLLKMKRMRIVALNGLLILIPCAFLLARWAEYEPHSLRFYFVQAIEIFAGSVNLVMLILNMKAGIKLRLGSRRSSVITQGN
jgi:hypothetical protein